MSAKLPQLSQKVALMSPLRSPDGAGGFVEDWVELGQMWAEIVPRTGRAVASLDLPLAQTGFRITVRAAPVGAPSRPVPGQIMRHGTRQFRLESVTEKDPGGRYLTCYAREDEVAT